MAIRSGAGTGVIVSLVVFVLATVFLLVLSIVFYASNREQMELVNTAEANLNVFATSNEQSSDAVQTIIALAKESNQSVTSYLNSQVEDRNRMITGNPSSSTEDIRTELGSVLGNNSPLAITVDQLQRSLNSRQEEINANLLALNEANQQIQSLEEQLASQVEFAASEVESVKEQWQDVQDESAQLNTKANDYFSTREERDSRLRGGFQGRIQQLETDVDELRIERARLQSTIDELRDKVDLGKMGEVNPATLVDGTVLEVSTGDEVFIDRGANDRIILGMTFEVYDSPAQLRLDQDGEFPAGKASIEVVKVGETTSTAKITRSTTSQPIVRSNILVNAIYDPEYNYTFLVHGNFDANGDGIPEADNGFIQDQIRHWGGKVVADNGALPGDLDFLVLGIAPVEPAGKPPHGATPAMLDDYARQKRAFLDYEHLLEQARSAQVPVLTANRLHILTGQR